ncbi:hypothetical protein BC832DRAFT_385917 [Gaertneriomyces semiglobifer]|nr:hypothetical protein BC832DRAFT_385917 [Gaertneriomyces semiglobifer]
MFPKQYHLLYSNSQISNFPHPNRSSRRRSCGGRWAEFPLQNRGLHKSTQRTIKTIHRNVWHDTMKRFPELLTSPFPISHTTTPIHTTSISTSPSCQWNRQSQTGIWCLNKEPSSHNTRPPPPSYQSVRHRPFGNRRSLNCKNEIGNAVANGKLETVRGKVGSRVVIYYVSVGVR